MDRMAAIFGSVLFLVASYAAPAYAVGEDVFVVPRVTVQAKAKSATSAKAAAQLQGRRRAIDILLRRLTVEEDWVYLPTLATGEPAEAISDLERGVITLTDRDLELLESGFEVYNEKSSSSTYRAFITYRFKPDTIRKLLRDARIPYSEVQTRTALVLPVLQTKNGAYLWEENNPWMAAWKVRPYDNELTPMIAPLGDLEDTATITARQALALNENALYEIAQRYSVSQVIVAHAFLQQIDGEDRLRVRLINGFRESGNVDNLDELGQFEGDEKFAGTYRQGPATNEYIPAKVGEIISESWFRQPSGNFPTLAERSIEVAIAKYAKPWKTRTLIDHSASALLSVSAHYRSIGEWGKIRSALVSTPLIGYVQVRSFSRRGAEMLIQAYGDPTKLIVAMEAQGLALWSDDGDFWMIATPDAAREVQRGSRRKGRGRLGDAGSEDYRYRPASFDEPGEQSAKTEQGY